MKKSEWLTCTDPQPMLAFLWGKEYERNLRKSRERKTRLFAIACILPLLHRMSHEPGLEAVEVSERFADGLASEEELELARQRFDQRIHGTRLVLADDAARAIHGACWTPSDCANHNQASYTASWAVEAAFPGGDWTEWDEDEALREIGRLRDLHETEQHCQQCVLLRDIFGPLPFRKVSIPSPVLAWNDRCVVNLAAGIYLDRAFDRLPILADALEEAGCTDAEILSHCREQGEHVRGCWVVDLCVGKR